MTTPDRRRGGRRITDLATHDQAHLRVSQVARYLQVDRRTVSKWVEAGILGALRTPEGSFRISTVDLRAFVERHRVATLEDAHGDAPRDTAAATHSARVERRVSSASDSPLSP